MSAANPPHNQGHHPHGAIQIGRLIAQETDHATGNKAEKNKYSRIPHSIHTTAESNKEIFTQGRNMEITPTAEAIRMNLRCLLIV